MKFRSFISNCSLALALIMSLSACQSKEASVEENVRKVKAQMVESGNTTSGYDYIGVIKAKEMKNYSFLIGGKIQEICVEKGQKVSKGDIIARLDTKSLELNGEIGSNSIDQAKATYEKTLDTYNTNIENAKSQIKSLDLAIEAGKKGVEALKEALKAEEKALNASKASLDTLYSEVEAAREINKVGGLSDKDLESAENGYELKNAEYQGALAKFQGNKANLEAKEAELNASISKRDEAKKTLDNLIVSKQKDIEMAKSNVSNASINKEIVQKNINDATIKAESDGYVMELPFKEGEVISAGYPVAVVKSNDLIVSIGVSYDELSKISVGSKAIINSNLSGFVTSISQYPDEESRKYNVDISLSESLPIGEVVNVKIVTGEGSGFYVPMTAIFNENGVDYVFVINSQSHLVKKEVQVCEVKESKVLVKGLDESYLIVSDGVNSLNENDFVSVEE